MLVVDSAAKLQALYSLATDPAPTVVAFFVDKLTFCATVEPTSNEYGGCAQLPGRVFVEDFHVAEVMAATLTGHELGHNLNLEHDLFDPTNLMSVLPPHGTSLREEQVAIILQSPLVQIDSTGQRFIQITPIAIVDAPEPSMLLLFGAALGALLIVKTRTALT